MRVLYPSVFSLSPLSRHVDEMFKAMFEPGVASPDSGVGPRAFPPLSAWEDAKSFTVEAELPGFRLDDLDISVSGAGRELTIKGKRSIALPEGAELLVDERGEGEFTRSIRLGVPVEPDKVSASMRDGVLTISLPKSELAQPRRIAVKAAGDN
ncbi:MAG: Hsp20/alpha crystallin family protein [Phycisphaerales bacterium]